MTNEEISKRMIEVAVEAETIGKELLDLREKNEELVQANNKKIALKELRLTTLQAEHNALNKL